MSSGNEPHECIQFLPNKSDLNSKTVDTIYNEQEIYPNNEENTQDTPNDVGCCSQFFRLIHRMQNVYTWKIPWIIILISAVQVYNSNIYFV